MFHGLTLTLVSTEPRPIMIDLFKNFFEKLQPIKLFYRLFKTIINFHSFKINKKKSALTQNYKLWGHLRLNLGRDLLKG